MQGCNPQLPEHYLMYLDANNLYGWAMCQSAPTNCFEWLNSEGVETLNVSSISVDGNTGYVLEVSLRFKIV